MAPPRGVSIRTYWPPLGGVNKNLLAPPKNYYVDDAALFQYSIAAGHAIIFRSVAPGDSPAEEVACCLLQTF